jgi:hypothetical protein
MKENTNTCVSVSESVRLTKYPPIISILLKTKDFILLYGSIISYFSAFLSVSVSLHTHTTYTQSNIYICICIYVCICLYLDLYLDRYRYRCIYKYICSATIHLICRHFFSIMMSFLLNIYPEVGLLDHT